MERSMMGFDKEAAMLLAATLSRPMSAVPESWGEDCLRTRIATKEVPDGPELAGCVASLLDFASERGQKAIDICTVKADDYFDVVVRLSR